MSVGGRWQALPDSDGKDETNALLATAAQATMMLNISKRDVERMVADGRPPKPIRPEWGKQHREFVEFTWREVNHEGTEALLKFLGDCARYLSDFIGGEVNKN
jgi:hypothetical protein